MQLNLDTISQLKRRLNNQIESQKSDFMTTFAKRKDGPKSMSGVSDNGLVSKDKLRAKQAEKPATDSSPNSKNKKYQRPNLGAQKIKDVPKKEEVS